MLISNNKYISVGGVILMSLALPACTTIRDTGRGTSVQNSEIGYLSYLGRSVRLYRDKKDFLDKNYNCITVVFSKSSFEKIRKQRLKYVAVDGVFTEFSNGTNEDRKNMLFLYQTYRGSLIQKVCDYNKALLVRKYRTIELR